mgnify:CR=1 FL=1
MMFLSSTLCGSDRHTSMYKILTLTLVLFVCISPSQSELTEDDFYVNVTFTYEQKTNEGQSVWTYNYVSKASHTNIQSFWIRVCDTYLPEAVCRPEDGSYGTCSESDDPEMSPATDKGFEW